MAQKPQFATDPQHDLSQVSAANTNRDGTGTVVTVLTAGGRGSRVEEVKVKAVGTTTAGMVRLYVYDGTDTRLIEEIPVAAVTPSATVETFEASVVFANLVLPAATTAYQLRASTHNAETFNVHVMGANY